MSEGRKWLLRWTAWFYVGQVSICWLMSSAYFLGIPGFSVVQRLSLAVVAGFLGHIALMAMLPSLLVLFLIFLWPSRRLIFFTASLMAVLVSSYLFLDTFVYYLYHYHLNGAVLSLTYYGIFKGIFGLSWLEKMIPIMMIGMMLVLELWFARALWRLLHTANKPLPSLACCLSVPLFFIAIAYLGVALHMDRKILRTYVEKTTFLPFYAHGLRIIMPKEKQALAWVEADDSAWLSATLHYPRHALQFDLPATPMNLLVIGIDSWRYDMLNAEVTPYLYALAKHAWVFDHHVSGGNATGPGIFSLFYGLPASYMTSMESQQQGPLLFSQLIKHHYQTAVFSSAPLYSPPMDRSVFVDLASHGKAQSLLGTVLLRDAQVVKDFRHFIENKKQDRPFFSFLFFDAAHSYCGSDEIPGPFQPMATQCNRATFNKKTDYTLYLNRYKNALLTIDAKIHQVMDVLRDQQLLDRTVVIIVGDHGEEFDDSGRGYYGHASNFTHYQMQTPLLVYWPSETPQVFHHVTSHFDVVPTLMKKLLGCLNPASDYSVGMDLLSDKPRSHLIVSSYVDYAIVEPEKVTRIYAAGNYRVENPFAEPMQGSEISVAVLHDAFAEMRAFYRQE